MSNDLTPLSHAHLNSLVLKLAVEKNLGTYDINRIVVGKDDGLAYKLFSLGFSSRWSKSSYIQAVELREYFEKENRYVEKAKDYATKYGFDLVTINPTDNAIITGCTNGMIYNSGIGSARIESVEKVDGFIQMISNWDDMIELKKDLVLLICEQRRILRKRN